VGTTSAPIADTQQGSGKAYLWFGVGLVLLGPMLWMVQLRAKLFVVPWYVLALAAAGVVLLLLAVLRRHSIWRIVALVLCGALAASEGYFLLSLSKVPDYHGPVAAGVAFPQFKTRLANGSVFNQDSLRGEQNTALVFFRGRW
jgi:FtsH-binding integral membrane protein